MIYTLSNSELSISVNKTGIELCSVISQSTGIEYMWQADSEVWGSHAPVLFPIIGALKDNQYRFKGDVYELPKHGFVRYNEHIELRRQTESSLHFSLSWSKESLKHFPFKFEFQTRFILNGSKLTIEHSVVNQDDQPIYFSLGGHPAFNCPLLEGESYSDYYIEFDRNETASACLLNSSGLVSYKKAPMLNDSRKLPLHKHLFDNDALIFKHLKSRKAKLVSNLHGPVLSMDYDGFPYLGIWAKPGAPFICIEPWQGIADAAHTSQEFTQKEGIISLGAGKTHTADYSIYFHEIKAGK